jgi:hypothetical protein
VYQFQFAPVPKLPPVIPSVILLPEQIGLVPVAVIAGVEGVFTVTFVLAQVVVKQIPSALKKYVVVIVGIITGAEPEIIYVAPQEPVYQYQLDPVPNDPPETPRVVFEPEHIGDVEVADMAGVDKVFTVIVVFTHAVELHVPAADK